MGRARQGFFWPMYPLLVWGLGLSVQHFNVVIRGQITDDWLYLRSTTGATFLGKYGMILLTLLLLLINAFSYWGPNPQNTQEVALFLPTVYVVSALLADWMDGKRSHKAVSVRESLQPATQA